jgi:hypothetical protein
MITTSEKATQKSITLPLRALHDLLVGVVPGARPLHYPALRCLKWGWFALFRDLGEQSTLL